MAKFIISSINEIPRVRGLLQRENLRVDVRSEAGSGAEHDAIFFW